MSIHQHATLADTVYFWFASNDTSGSGADGATPLFDVRLAGAASNAAPVLSGSPAVLSHVNYPDGCYEATIAATVGNGFAAGNTYAVFCTLLVDSQNPTGFVGSFTLGPIIANVTQISGGATEADRLQAALGTGDYIAADLIADTITAAKIADNAFSTEHFAGSYYQDIAETMYARPTWYVAKTGDNSDGLSFDTAFLTVAQAVAACAAGDRIKVGPGTFAEDVTLNGKAGVLIEGGGKGVTIFGSGGGAGNYALILEDYCEARNLTAGTGSEQFGLALDFLGLGADGVTIRNCDVFGTADGLVAGASVDLFMIDSIFRSNVDGAQMSGATRFRAVNCTFFSDGSTGAQAQAVFGTGADATGDFINCQLLAIRTANTVSGTAAISLQGDNISLYDCTLFAKSSHVNATGSVVGLNVPSGSIAAALSCKIATDNTGTAGGVIYDLANAGTLAVGGCDYDPTKTLGTITLVAQDVFMVDISNVETVAPRNSLCISLLAKLHGNLVDNAGKLTVYQTDDATELFQFTVGTNASASPVTGVSD